ncbi:hypothetical protein M3Y94_01286400 [Aphelenchoides besseyi]|nr:hypothetical protein M3Y94_01286400 [Aphelenchoides besseyi]
MDNQLVDKVIATISQESELTKNSTVFTALMNLINRAEVHQSSQKTPIVPTAVQFLDSLDSWPIAFFYAVLHDSLGSRLWVDKSEASPLVLAAFSLFGDTRLPSRAMTSNLLEKEGMILESTQKPQKYQLPPEQQTSIVKKTMDYVQKSMETGAVKPLLRTLCFLCSHESFRSLIATKLDGWLLSGKYQKWAMELLLFLACNIRDQTESKVDSTVLTCLSRIKPQKSRQIQNVFQAAISEIISSSPDSLSDFVDLIIENDFGSTIKAQNNIPFLQFLYDPSEPTALFNAVAYRLIKRIEKPESVKSARQMIRELHRALRDWDFSIFARHLMQAIRSYSKMPTELQLTVFRGGVDLIAMLPFLSITSAVREAAQLRRNSGSLSTVQSELLNRFQLQFHQTTLMAVDFFRKLMESFSLEPSAYHQAFYSILYLRTYSNYSSFESWPSEPDFNNMVRILSECSIPEELLDNLMSLNQKFLTANEILTIVENLTKRTINIRGVELNAERGICVQEPKTIDKLFELSKYEEKHESPPQLADRPRYWRCWEQTFTWCCMNEMLMQKVYSKLPILRMFCTMAITKDFTFPPSHLDGLTADQLRSSDDEEREREWAAIYKLERYEEEAREESGSGSAISSTICLLNQSGPCRHPPKELLERLEKANDQSEIGVTLCRLRDPDVLANVAADQGAHRVMPTLIPFVISNPLVIEVLPLSCISQLYLLATCQQNGMSTDELMHGMQITKTLSADLRLLIQKTIESYVKDESKPLEKCKVVIEFLVGKLAAPFAGERDVAAVALNQIFQPVAPVGDFDVRLLQRAAHFKEIAEDLCLLVASACALEKHSQRVMYYMDFVVKNIGSDALHRVAPRLSSLVERSSTSSEEHKSIRRSLNGFFSDFMQKLVRNGRNQDLKVPSADDRLLLQLEYPERVKVEVDREIVAAIVELLCESFGDDQKETKEYENRNFLRMIWFPNEKQKVKIFTANGHESTVLDVLSQSLKMKMLSSKDEQIVRAALEGASPETALHWIQSFALTPYSCSELLKLLNNSPVGCSDEAYSAMAFVRAYKVRGAEGADEFLRRLKHRNQNSEMKMEVDEKQYFSEIVGPSSVYKSNLNEPTKPMDQNAHLDGRSIEQFLRSMLGQESSFLLTDQWVEFTKKLKEPRTATETVDFLIDQLEILHQNSPTILYSLVMAMARAGREDPEIAGIISRLREHCESRGQVGRSLLSMLAPFRQPKFAETKNVEMIDVDEMSELNADQIVQRLTELDQIGTSESKLEINRLLQHHSLLRPEVIDLNQANVEEQIRSLFSTESPSIRCLVAQITTNKNALVIHGTLQILLREFDERLLSQQVVEFVENIVGLPGSKYLRSSAAPWLVLLQHLQICLRQKEDCQRSQSTLLNQYTCLLKSCISNDGTTAKRILQPIFDRIHSQLSEIARQPTDLRDSQYATWVSILKSVDSVFPESTLRQKKQTVDFGGLLSTRRIGAEDAMDNQ